MSHEPIPIGLVRGALDAWDLGGADVVVEPIPPGATADVFLVQRGDDRWVAKYAYQDVASFDAGLAVSEVLDLPDWSVATPARTSRDGARYVVVPWPDGADHALALLRWVDGRPLEHDAPGHVECKATVCARVHAPLIDLDPAVVGLEVPRQDAPPDPLPPWDLGPHQWLDEVFVDLQQQTIGWRDADGVRSGVGVWDGPDVRIGEDGTIGLIDFGHVAYQPLVNVVANRSLSGDDQGRASLPRFLDALQRHLPLTAEELAALDCFRRYNVAIYARWAAMRRQEHGERSRDDWLASLLRFLRADADVG